ncbi:type II toxin-antitoxin system HicA family toxin [Enterococcus faecalis]|uniref:type II toxin-antitoxin system HicA family toxin n=1 Tax=Enterococcus faecalis TaxID=1351 RepID=UPI002DBE6CC7|nr:type II toxin-antitoxin system HicA family toxin [Enterococcus faecalis]MEB7774855.1 type II toxin-antitoxin system HicA family toxin [Enterococcus faecalis]
MPLTGKDLLKLARANGWEVVRVNGSHHRLVNEKLNRKVTIAVHANKDIPKGTEQKILKDLGLK